MLIKCPWCGEREYDEFRYGGDATVTRPHATQQDNPEVWYDYIFLRDNPCGSHEEWWFHANGCHQWVRVCRDTLSHDIMRVMTAATSSANGESS